MTLYRIKDWNKHFENNRTRELEKMKWVPVPNKQDGDGYTSLIEHENGPAHFGAWCAIVQVASKCEPRGTLLRASGKPHDAQSLSRITRFPAKILEEAIERLASSEVGWLEVVDPQELTETPQSDAEIPQADAGIPPPPALNGTERNGREEHYPIDRIRATERSFSYEESEEIRNTAEGILKIVPVRKGQQQDRSLVLLAATLKVRRIIDHAAVDRAVDAVADARPAPRNPVAYFRKCLNTQCELRGLRLVDLESLVELPPALHRRAREPTPAGSADG